MGEKYVNWYTVPENERPFTFPLPPRVRLRSVLKPYEEMIGSRVGAGGKTSYWYHHQNSAVLWDKDEFQLPMKEFLVRRAQFPEKLVNAAGMTPWRYHFNKLRDCGYMNDEFRITPVGKPYQEKIESLYYDWAYRDEYQNKQRKIRDGVDFLSWYDTDDFNMYEVGSPELEVWKQTLSFKGHWFGALPMLRSIQWNPDARLIYTRLIQETLNAFNRLPRDQVLMDTEDQEGILNNYIKALKAVGFAKDFEHVKLERREEKE